ncbi:hypothetical protein BSNK01_15260 [Bacillaceae bacterium]
MRLFDALFNWLQIKVVSAARPWDKPAKDTADFFAQILREDHRVENLRYTRNGTMYHLRFTQEGKTKTQMFDAEAVEKLLRDLESDPRYDG